MDTKNLSERSLRNVAVALDLNLERMYGRKMGFCLIVFEFNTPNADYVSNGSRQQMVGVLRTTADRIEQNAVIPRAATDTIQ